MIGGHMPYGWLLTLDQPIDPHKSTKYARCSIAYGGAPAFDDTKILPARYLSKIAPYQTGAPCI